jgi:ribosome assembly protein 1
VFDPGKGNVLFCSAVDGWGFTVPQFARLYSSKFGFSASALARALWGPYALQAKAPKGSVRGVKALTIVPLSRAAPGTLPMFAQLVLTPLWSAYEATDAWSDGAAILSKIVRSQALQVPDKTVVAAGKPGLQVPPPPRRSCRAPVATVPTLMGAVCRR